MIVDEFLNIREMENYKTEIEEGIKRDGANFVQLESICSFRQSTRNKMVKMWTGLITQINALRIIDFFEKPQYAPIYDKFMKKWSCFVGNENDNKFVF